MPPSLDHFGWARIACSTHIAALRKLEASAIGGLEHGFMVLEEGQTQLRFLHVDQREFSLFLINPQMHRARLNRSARHWYTDIDAQAQVLDCSRKHVYESHAL